MAADSLIADTTARIFADFADPHVVNAASDDLWRDEFWRALVDAGLPLLWVPEEAGGIGATFAEGLAALEAAGAKACAVPLAETMAGAWLLARAGLNVPTERLALLPPGLRLDATGRLWGHAVAAPFAFGAKHLAGIVEGADGAPHVVLVEPPSRMDRCEDLAGDERGSAQFGGEPPVAGTSLSSEVGRDDLLLLSAAARAALMAGALGALVELSIGYAQERQAFGRTISRFRRFSICWPGLSARRLPLRSPHKLPAGPLTGHQARLPARDSTLRRPRYGPARRQGSVRRLPIRFTAPSATRPNTFCTGSLAASGHGATTMAARHSGPGSSADMSQRPGPRAFGAS